MKGKKQNEERGLARKQIAAAEMEGLQILPA
jgi:hypothetical protein